MTVLNVEMGDAIELAELCELLDRWLAECPEGTASYNRYIGTVDAAEDLRTALAHFAAVLTVAPTAGATQ
jgi:hypothetical protein